jgi:hypothetical protein
MIKNALSEMFHNERKFSLLSFHKNFKPFLFTSLKAIRCRREITVILMEFFLINYKIIEEIILHTLLSTLLKKVKANNKSDN